MTFNRKAFVFLYAAVFAFVRTNAQDFTLANTLQDNMVIQQGKPLTIWGNAKPGQVITAKADWQPNSYKGKANEIGEWKIQIPVPEARPNEFTPHTLKVKSGKNIRSIKDILFGDVWLCSGQSNMDMTVKPFLPWLMGAMHYEQEIENANYPQVRMFDVANDFKAIPASDCKKGEWKLCTPATAGDFSALAYFFARDLFLRRQIPVGIVLSSLGGSSCQAWVSRDTLIKDSALYRKYVYSYDTSRFSKEPIDSVVTFEKVVRPSLLYNAMIYPLRNIRFKGMLWYQGESNRYDGALYTRLCASMINNWRQLFHQNDLPFYYVQVAPYSWHQNDPAAFEYAILREAQAKICETIPQTAMAVTMDIADPLDIHPRNKQDLGYRLANIALSNSYGVKGKTWRGPEWQSIAIADSTVKIKFKPETIGSGLATIDGQDPKHFFVAGADSVFHPAEAKIVNNEVWVKSPFINKPVAVRYAFTNYPVTNFCNKEGYPAVPFRSGF